VPGKSNAKRNYKASGITPKRLSGSLEIQYFPSGQLRKVRDGRNLDTQNRTQFVIDMAFPPLLLSTHTTDTFSSELVQNVIFR
jgi:hypothetical protein